MYIYIYIYIDIVCWSTGWSLLSLLICHLFTYTIYIYIYKYMFLIAQTQIMITYVLGWWLHPDSPPVRLGLLDFKSAGLVLLLIPLLLRTSTASSWSQWSLPDPNSKLRFRVFPAGPRPQRISEDLSDRMPERTPDRMPHKVPQEMPERMSE